MLKRTFAVVLAVSALSACGTADSKESAGESTAGSSAPECEQLVDGATYTKVLDGSSTSGLAVSTWLRTRSTTGASVPGMENQYSDLTSVTVCLMDAPGIAIPDPPKPGQTDDTAGEQYAIVLLGADKEPVIDSVGPAAKVQALFDKLPALH